MIASATLIVLRDRGQRAEVLLVRRHPDLNFMGGLWAFPGGRVEPADVGIALGDVETTSRVAACRETFEECALRFAPRDLLLWSHWITPAGAARRYDTRFYVVEMHNKVEIVLDQTELVDFDWLTPQAAVVAAQASTHRVSPPTHFVLEDLRLTLERHGNLTELLAAEQRRVVPPITPRLRDVDGRREVVMPWESGYLDLPGDGQPLIEHRPEHIRRLAALGGPRLEPVIAIR